jgi:hypothetical protein
MGFLEWDADRGHMAGMRLNYLALEIEKEFISF